MLLPQEIIDKCVYLTNDIKTINEFGTEYIKKKYWKVCFNAVIKDIISYGIVHNNIEPFQYYFEDFDDSNYKKYKNDELYRDIKSGTELLITSHKCYCLEQRSFIIKLEKKMQLHQVLKECIDSGYAICESHFFLECVNIVERKSFMVIKLWFGS